MRNEKKEAGARDLEWELDEEQTIDRRIRVRGVDHQLFAVRVTRRGQEPAARPRDDADELVYVRPPPPISSMFPAVRPVDTFPPQIAENDDGDDIIDVRDSWLVEPMDDFDLALKLAPPIPKK